MSNTHQSKWLDISRKLQAIAQTGLAFSNNVFDTERYQNILEIASQIMADDAKENQDELLAIISQDFTYPTPKIDVRGAVFKDGEILLVREISDGLWTLPGGWADINTSAGESVIREIYEEAGFKTKIIKLIALLDKQKHSHPQELLHAYKALFLCEIISGVATPSHETSEVAFFSKNNLPNLSEPRIVKSQIELCFEHYQNPDLVTVYD